MQAIHDGRARLSVQEVRWPRRVFRRFLFFGLEMRAVIQFRRIALR